MNYVIMGLGIFYGIIMVISGGLLFTQKRLGRISASLMLFGGMVITAMFIYGQIGLMLREVVLILGLIMVHISAVLNGYKLHGRPLVKEHVIRGCVSVLLVVGNYYLFK